MKKRIVIIGGGGYAKVIISVINKINDFEVVGYTDIVDKGSILGVKYLGTDEILTDIIKNDKNCNAVIGIGNITISDNRYKIYKLLKELGFGLPVIISKTAIINEEVKIGEGTVIMECALVNVGSVIGKAVIINTAAVIEHDCIVGDFVHFATGSVIGGGVEIGNNAIIGMGAKVIQYKKVGENCLIDIGSIVIKDTLIEGTYFGIPAARINV